MGTSGRTSHKNYARKRGKYTSSKRKKVQERASLQKFSIGLNNTTNTIKQSIRWQRVRWDPVKLYPNIIFDKNDNPDRRPTPEEVALACKISSRAGKIIGKYFKELSSVAFNNNRATMKKFNIPSFDHLSYGEKPSPTTCSPHITFTTKNFFNPPHIDKGDLSDYAFVMFLPTYSATGKLAPPDSNYNVSGGPFVFPDHQFGIKFDHQHGIVKMIWKANEYRHCTLPSSSSSTFTRLGFSLQINYSLARTF
ncbi:hypothetical protein H4Q26_009553 [Puccinia striiformis f. sp. tritici PST-130]|nr:hypothetical protein H4Q26_009553 [Puccinia striiformis f. sp. tritici PST-130]